MTALVDTGWLAARLDDPGIAAVEVDKNTTAYGKGPIEGAVALDWEHELRAAPRRDFADADALALLLGSNGISDGHGSWTEYGSLVDVPVEL